MDHFKLDTKKLNTLQTQSLKNIIEISRQAHLIDIHVRVNGEWRVFEGDWIKNISLGGFYDVPK